jgi:DNA-binding response OmpR family regulator
MAPPTLLAVDDESELLSLLAEYFGRQGFRVLTASDAATARARVASETPQVAVIDVHMPGEDGRRVALATARAAAALASVVRFRSAGRTADPSRPEPVKRIRLLRHGSRLGRQRLAVPRWL